jgi:hypothetical protein
MPPYIHKFTFTEEDRHEVRGQLELEEPLPYQTNSTGSGFYRPGRLVLEDGPGLEIVLYHNPATAAFIYLRSALLEPKLCAIIGLVLPQADAGSSMRLPGALCLGSERARLIEQAMQDLFAAPPMRSTISAYQQQNLAVFPIAREGLKYQVTEAIHHNYGYYCDEVVLDAHHVFDSSVPVFKRKVEMTIFKDKDLDAEQHRNIRVPFIADSIASGLVMKETILQVRQRFAHIDRVEVVSPLATIRGLYRIACTKGAECTPVRVHSFETLLDALPPDYYYSAHFNIPELHIRPELEAEYRQWWGMDAQGRHIADTACAGYGWSEVFYSPRKQIEMINSQLQMRHNLTIVDIINRNMAA